MKGSDSATMPETVVMVRAGWPRARCPNPLVADHHEFEYYPPGDVFLCGSCGEWVRTEEVQQLRKWWLYVSLFAGEVVETANKWN